MHSHYKPLKREDGHSAVDINRKVDIQFNQRLLIFHKMEHFSADNTRLGVQTSKSLHKYKSNVRIF